MTTAPPPGTNGVPVGIVGATGLVGSNILAALLKHPRISTVSSFSRKSLEVDDPHSRLRPIVDAESTQWPASFVRGPEIFYSGLGTTRAIAGGLENQRKIDHDLNIALARAAKDAGVKVYVLISSAGANKTSYNPYLKMKGEIEEAVSELGFEKTVLIKPGLLVGTRRAEDSRLSEYILRSVAVGVGKVSGGRLKDFWAQDADVVGKAAFAAGLRALDGKAPEGKVWTVGQADVIKFGRTEWTDS